MATCPYQQDIAGSALKRCLKMTAASGWPRSVSLRICTRCISLGDFQRDIADATFLKMLYNEGVRARFIAGDSPRYGAKDMLALFQKVRDEQGDSVARETLRQSFEHQARLTEDQGGHSVSELIRRMRAVANAHGMGDVIRELERKYGQR